MSEVRARLGCEESLGFRNSQSVSNFFFSLALATRKWKTYSPGCVVKARLKALSPTVPASWRCFLRIVLWSMLRVGGALGSVRSWAKGLLSKEVLQEARHRHHELKAGM